MIRELMVNGAKNIPANYAAKVAMVTGMGVQLVKGEVVLLLFVDHKAGQVKFPDAATAEGIEMVAHEFIPEGIYASQTNFDDYDKMATEIKAGVLVKRVPLYAGELYGTDQYKDGDAQDTNIGKLLEVNIDGKWQVATTGTSRFEFAGVMDDNGHKLIMISVLPEAKTVA